MADISKLRQLNTSGIPTTIDLTASGNVLQAAMFQIVNASVTASKPLKLDADKKFTSGDINLTSEVTGTLPVANGGTNSTTTLNNNRVMKSSSGAIVEAAAITADRALISDSNGIPAHSTITATKLGYLSDVTSNIQAQINALTTGYARRAKVIDYVSPISAPPTEVSGDRYILDFTSGTVHADWDGAAKGDIVTFNGTTWVAETPVEGWVAYVDQDNKDIIYLDDGTPAWEFRPTAVNDHGDLTGLADDDHTQYHTDTRGDARYYQKTEFINSSAGSGDAGKPVKLDADGNIDGSMINDADVSHSGLTGTHNLTTDIDHGSISGLSDDDHSQYLLATGGRNLSGKQSYASHPSFSSDTELVDKKYVDDAVAGASPGQIDFLGVAGESFAANKTYVVRWGVTGETAGRVYKCTSDHENSPNKFFAIGVIQPTVAISAGDSVTVIKFAVGLKLLSDDTNFSAATDDGKPLFLNTAGAFSTVLTSGIGGGDQYAVNMIGIQTKYNATVTNSEFNVDCSLNGVGIDIA